jgi:transcriptional regulator with XRE-family HTH domain
MKFGERLRALREKRGLSQAELGRAVGLTVRSIGGYETGGRYPRHRDVYTKLAEALDVKPDYLLSEGDVFIIDAQDKFGYRGKKDAEELVGEVTGLFAGGEMAEEDMDAMMLAIQEAYLIAKKNNKKYTPHKYRKLGG